MLLVLAFLILFSAAGFAEEQQPCLYTPCTLQCPYGFKADEKGCKLCECVETGCIGEGGSIAVIPNPSQCCTGLGLIPPIEEQMTGSSGICTSKCGNGTCDTATESNYNCSVDCAPLPCKKEGEYIPLMQAPPKCCEGLSAVPVYDVKNVSAVCKSPPTSGGSGGTGTVKPVEKPPSTSGTTDTTTTPVVSGGSTPGTTMPVAEGYRGAYWQCYNGEESKNEDAACQYPQVWRARAETFCSGKCGGEKCGVNSFQVYGYCGCTNFTDEQGCKVTKCEDGRYDRVCPVSGVTCEKQEEPATGCIIKKCSDGYVDRWCPTAATECKTYVDEQGCKVTSCANGQTSRSCPQETCDKYRREDGCVVKKCGSGEVYVECPASTTLPTTAIPESCIEVRDESGNVVGKECRAVAVNAVPVFTNACPTEEDIKRRIEACSAANGVPFTVISPNNCKTINCRMSATGSTAAQAETAATCVRQPIEEIRKIKDACASKGGKVVVNFNEGGCEQYQCLNTWETQNCERERNIPEEKKKSCEANGGQFVVKTNESGCITFVDCVMQSEGTYASPEIRRVPDVAELTDLAFKLESLKIEFDQLAKKAKGIAAYYSENGKEADANRFNRVAAMLSSAKDKIDEIKDKIRANLDNFDTGLAGSVKDSIRYIKDVLLKDVLYIMLGGEEKTGEACSDISCFERALRSCTPSTIKVKEGGKEMTIVISGVKENLCGMNAETGDGINTYDMACKIPDFSLIALSQFNPEKHCEGNLLDYMAGKIETAAAPPQVTEAAQRPISCEDLSEEVCEKTDGCTAVRRGVPPGGTASDADFVRCDPVASGNSAMTETAIKEEAPAN